VSETVDSFYAVLLAEARIKLAESLVADAEQLEALTAKQIEAGKGTATEKTRVRMAVEAAIQALHGHEFELAVAKAKLRPLIGRTASDPDFEVVGTLDVKAVVPVPELQDAIALAEAHRPDLTSDRTAIAQSAATVHWEQRKAKPQVAITPGWSYQYQRQITGFRNGSLLDVGVQFALPVSDRNQGNIRKAQWQLAETRLNHQANVADVRAEIEIVIASYADAVEDVTEHDDPATLKAALEMAKKADAEFQTNQRKLVELLDIRRVSSEQQIRHVEFQAAYWRALNKLNTVVGLTAYDPATAKTVPIEYGKAKEPAKK
jgi:outer membrane protein, heavy metal efflux system